MDEFTLLKREVSEEEGHYPEKLRRVLLLYTGGTIGMKWDKDTGDY